jgi:hypothetical protein
MEEGGGSCLNTSQLTESVWTAPVPPPASNPAFQISALEGSLGALLSHPMVMCQGHVYKCRGASKEIYSEHCPRPNLSTYESCPCLRVMVLRAEGRSGRTKSRAEIKINVHTMQKDTQIAPFNPSCQWGCRMHFTLTEIRL